MFAASRILWTFWNGATIVQSELFPRAEKFEDRFLVSESEMQSQLYLYKSMPWNLFWFFFAVATERVLPAICLEAFCTDLTVDDFLKVAARCPDESSNAPELRDAQGRSKSSSSCAHHQSDSYTEHAQDDQKPAPSRQELHAPCLWRDLSLCLEESLSASAAHDRARLSAGPCKPLRSR